MKVSYKKMCYVSAMKKKIYYYVCSLSFRFSSRKFKWQHDKISTRKTETRTQTNGYR